MGNVFSPQILLLNNIIKTNNDVNTNRWLKQKHIPLINNLTIGLALKVFKLSFKIIVQNFPMEKIIGAFFIFLNLNFLIDCVRTVYQREAVQPEQT